MFEPHADLGEHPNQVSCPHDRVSLLEGLLRLWSASLITLPLTLVLLRSRVRTAVHRRSMAVDPVWPDKYGGPALFGHDSVVLVPVFMLPAGSGEDLSAEPP